QRSLESSDDHQEAPRIDQEIGIKLGAVLRRVLRVETRQHLGNHARERGGLAAFDLWRERFARRARPGGLGWGAGLPRALLSPEFPGVVFNNPPPQHFTKSMPIRNTPRSSTRGLYLQS